MFALAFFLTACSLPIFSIGCMAAVCAMFRVHIERADVWGGPVILTRMWGDTEIRLHAIPGVASLTVAGANPFEEDPQPVPEGKRSVTDAPRWGRVMMPLAQLVGFAVLCAVMLGPTDAAAHVVGGLTQVPFGALSPFDTARTLIGAWVAVLEQRGSVVAIGVLIAKMLAIQLLPPVSSSLSRVAMVWGAVPARRMAHALVVVQVLSMLLFASWLVAIVAYFVA